MHAAATTAMQLASLAAAVVKIEEQYVGGGDGTAATHVLYLCRLSPHEASWFG